MRSTGTAPSRYRSPLEWSWVTAAHVVAAAAFSALLGTVLLIRPPLLYDEPWYMGTVKLLHEHGFGLRFLREFPGPAGPLYTLVHWALEPVTALQVPHVRLVNCAMLVLAIAGIARALRALGASASAFSAVGLLGVPMVLPTAGMALTEIPAVAFAAWALALLFVGLDDPSPVRRHGLMCAAGLAFGLSAIGRQPLVLALGCAPLLLVGHRERLSAVVTFVAVGACLPLALFAVWEGAIPPKVAFTVAFSARNALLAGGYGLIVLLLLAPRLVVMPWKWATAAIVVMVVLNLLLGLHDYLPLRTMLQGILPRGLWQPTARLFAGALLGVGAIFLLAIGRRLWAIRDDGRLLFLTASTLALVLVNARFAFQFSSRYLVPVLPFLVMLDAGADRPSAVRTVRLAIGSGIGLISLWSYLTFPHHQ